MSEILIAANDICHLDSVSNTLELRGYDVIRERDAKKVLEIAQNRKPSLIILDTDIPEINGYEIAKLLKSNPITKDMSILIFSAKEKSREMFKKALEVGAEDFINIPTTDEEIFLRVKVCLDRKKYIDELKNTDLAMRAAFDKIKETQAQLIQAEKLNAIGQLASGVAHEVRNPLAIALQSANYLEQTLPIEKKDVSETLNLLKSSIKKASDIITLLLDFSKTGNINLQPKDINSILESSLELVQHRMKFKNIKITKEFKTDIAKVLVDKNRIEQVFVDVLLNSIEAMPKGGEIIIRTFEEQLEKPENGIGRRTEDHFALGEKAVRVEIEDTGVGISEEDLKRMFEPFFTRKNATGGIGLGLVVSRNIINLHHGLISVTSKIDKGTKVTVTLKIAKEEGNE